MYREDILAHAYALVKSNQGAPGVDGQTFWGIETLGLEEWLNGIRNDLRAKTYQPQAGATGDDPEARWRREAARDSDYPGPGGADSRQAVAGTDL